MWIRGQVVGVEEAGEAVRVEYEDSAGRRLRERLVLCSRYLKFEGQPSSKYEDKEDDPDEEERKPYEYEAEDERNPTASSAKGAASAEAEPRKRRVRGAADSPGSPAAMTPEQQP